MYLIASIGIGLILGIFYWLSLSILAKRASLLSNQNSQKVLLTTSLHSFARMIIFAGIFFYVLQQTYLHSILIVFVFLTTLWLLLAFKKD
jgi:hypothetical protein